MEDRKQKRSRARYRQPIAGYPNVYVLKNRIAPGMVASFFFALAGAFGFVVGALLLSAGLSSAWGAETTACGPTMRETMYFARFDLSGPKSIQIGRTRSDDGKPATLAVIRNAATGNCDAVCSVQSLEIIDSKTPTAMQLVCRDTSLGAVQTPATLLWAKTSPLAYPALRFGSWLSGYQHSKLAVEVDTYSQSRTVSMRGVRFIGPKVAQLTNL